MAGSNQLVHLGRGIFVLPTAVTGLVVNTASKKGTYNLRVVCDGTEYRLSDITKERIGLILRRLSVPQSDVAEEWQ